MLLFAGCHSSSSTPEDLADVDQSIPDAAALDAGEIDGGVDGGSPGTSDEITSGTRLRAKRLVGGAGASLFSTWHDTLLDVDCSWGKTDDGSYRCYPPSANVYYSDAGCTAPAFYADYDCATPPKLVASYGTATCATKKLYRVGALLAPPAMFYAGIPGACTGYAPDPGYVFYAVSTASYTELAQGTVTREPRGTRLAADVFHGSDGSIEARAIWDTTRACHCQISDVHGEPEPSCVPLSRGYAMGPWFLDSVCATRLGYVASPDVEPFCNEAPNALNGAFDGSNFQLLQLGTEYTGTIYRSVGGCMPAMPGVIPTGARFYNIGAPIPASALAPFVAVTEGSERLRIRAITSSTGERLRGVAFFDEQRAVGCTPRSAADDQSRCLPFGADGYIYKDASCSVPVAQSNTGFAPPLLLFDEVPLNRCASRTHVYTIGATPITLTELYVDNGPGACQQVSPGTGVDYYDVTELPATTFAAVSRVQD